MKDVANRKKIWTERRDIQSVHALFMFLCFLYLCLFTTFQKSAFPLHVADQYRRKPIISIKSYLHTVLGNNRRSEEKYETIA